VAAFCAPLAGCGGSTTAEPAPDASDLHISTEERQSGDALQNRLLADGSASLPDLMSAIQGLTGCLAVYHIKVIDEGWNPVDNRTRSILYDPGAAAPDQVSSYTSQCQDSYLNRVADRYTAEHRAKMSPTLLADVQDCLSKAGVPAKGTETNVAEIFSSAGTAFREKATTCIKDGLLKDYPDKGYPIFE